MSADAAESTALKCLTWLIANEDLRGIFMGSSGLGEDELRARFGEPEFLAAVLDFILMDDTWVMQCGDATGMTPGSCNAVTRRAWPMTILPRPG